MSQNFETFGKYILLEKLAMGGMAEIYLARNSGASGVSKFVAIKRILPQFTEQTEFIDMFKDEAKIAVNLSHANIVSIFEFGIEKSAFFLAMDYIEGRNLRQILNKMKKSGLSFSIEQVLYVIKEVAGGLDHAHRCIDANTGKPLNIIHRDMSPQNVMVSFEGEVKIVDFGIAKAETQLETTRAGTLKGKFGYMSPEQAEGQPVDLRTDVFALGIVLWELLANDRLFVANNEVNTLRKIRECQIPSLRKINPAIPPELERIVSKALAKDRNLRYQTSAALHRELSRFLNRQYPDFSPQDFSVYIKNLFAGEILESRKKMIEYSRVDASKIPGAQPQPAEPTGNSTATDTQTEMDTPADNVDFGNPELRKNKTGPVPTPPSDPATAKSAKSATATPPMAQTEKRQTFEGVAAPANLTFERPPYASSGSVREGTMSSRSYSGVKREEANSSTVGFMMVLIFLGFLAGSSAFYYSNPPRATAIATNLFRTLGIFNETISTST
ncbi:MAG: serine/threonine-protein kinase, partial [Bdellovibrionota bacterium]